MAKKFTKQDAIRAVKKQSALLVFPIKGKKEPASLWSVFYPRSTMRWEWDESGDDRVVKLWYLRAELAESREIVYTKWFQGRATLFDLSLLSALLAVFESTQLKRKSLSPEAQRILDLLEENSPLSTKEVKNELGFRGPTGNRDYERATKELFARFLIQGVGEVDDGAFPSLALGATKLFFSKEWEEASGLAPSEAELQLKAAFGEENLFFKQLQKYQKKYLTADIEKHTSKELKSEISWSEL